MYNNIYNNNENYKGAINIKVFLNTCAKHLWRKFKPEEMKYSPCSWIGQLYVIKISILPQVISYIQNNFGQNPSKILGTT